MDNLPSILTVIIAIFVAFIGYLQWKTNKDKLRLDLFDRRFRIYSESRHMLQKVLIKGDLEFTDLNKLINLYNEGFFLFSKNVSALLNKMHGKAISLKRIKAELGRKKQLPEEEQDKLRNEYFDIIKWMDNNFLKYRDDFEKYLRFK